MSLSQSRGPSTPPTTIVGDWLALVALVVSFVACFVATVGYWAGSLSFVRLVVVFGLALVVLYLIVLHWSGRAQR